MDKKKLIKWALLGGAAYYLYQYFVGKSKISPLLTPEANTFFGIANRSSTPNKPASSVPNSKNSTSSKTEVNPTLANNPLLTDFPSRFS